jgi:phage baseplate assembly protein W
MMVSNYQLQLKDATWIDVNSEFTQNGLPDRLPNQLAIINCSLYNLLNCSPGQRARIFQPTYGSMWMAFIHEPILDITAAKMENKMIDAIDKWIPQIQLDRRNTSVKADTSLPGYRVRISIYTPFANDPQQIKFEVSL